MLKLAKLPLQYKILILNISMICFVLTLVGAMAVKIIIQQVLEDVGEQAMSIGRMVATAPGVKDAILSENPPEVLQPLCESWRVATDAAFIIVANMDQIRLSHPITSNVGTPLSNLYRAPVLRGEEYLYVARGSLPVSLRANVPIFSDDGERQIGFVSVGFYMKSIYEDAFAKFTPILYIFLAALAVSAIGSAFIARNVKKSIFGLEPHEIATILKERSATLESIREGVVAVDRDGLIRLINNEGGRILGLSIDKVIGCHIAEILPKNNLNTVILNGKEQFNEEQRVGDIVIISNSVPITVDSEVVGAVMSFRDRSEMHRLAEELTGINRFVDFLRAQAHEFKNKLHTIAGLIQLQRYEEAVNFAVDNQTGYQEMASRLNSRIKDSIIFGLLLGKAIHMRELGIDFTIDENTALSSLPPKITSGDIVLIIGNLLQNAIEAVETAKEKKVSISIVQQDAELEIVVSNTGNRIDDEIASKIYQRGFTTKKENGGLGLALIAEKLALASGRISHRNLPGEKVEFSVRLPY